MTGNQTPGCPPGPAGPRETAGALPPNPLDTQLDRALAGPGGLAVKLARARLDRLAHTCAFAAESSPFYRNLAGPELLRAAQGLRKALAGDIVPDRAEGLILSVLRDLPLTQPADLALNPESFLAVGQGEVEGLITVPSSGSGGQAKRIFSDSGDLKNTIEFFRYGMLNVLCPEKGTKVALSMSGQRPGSVGQLLTEALAFHGVGCEVLGFMPDGQKELAAYRERLANYGATTLVGLPSQIIYLARTGPKPKSLESVLLSGEPAPPSLVRGIAKAWGVEVFRHFGMTEFGLGGAVECRAQAGPHLREADLVWETLAPDGGPQNPGRVGSMVLTSLSRRAMPLIRYQTGDLGRLLPGPCRCGSVLRRIEVRGRSADLLIPGREANDFGFILGDLAERLYDLPFVTSFSASLWPERLLRLTLGTVGPDNGGHGLDQARKAIEGTFAGRLRYELRL
ncbi:MAG: hypothetical protein LBJ61_08700, partial [Deltaproteobacteria bacterium]|nr:hypothetical protein [Deltaproteobacteria bacterium]